MSNHSFQNTTSPSGNTRSQVTLEAETITSTATSQTSTKNISSSTMAAIANNLASNSLDINEIDNLQKQNAILVAKIAQLEDENLEKEDTIHQLKEDCDDLRDNTQKLYNTNRTLKSTNGYMKITIETYSHQLENLQDDFERSLLDQEENNIQNEEFRKMQKERDNANYSIDCYSYRVEAMTKDFEKTKAALETELSHEISFAKSLADDNLYFAQNNQLLSTSINELQMELKSKLQIIDDQNEQLQDKDEIIDGFEDIIDCLSPSTLDAIKRDCAAKQQELDAFTSESDSEPVFETSTASSANGFSDKLLFRNPASASAKNINKRRLRLTISDQISWDDCL